MADLLVNLLKLPVFEQDFRVRRAQPFELTPIRRFVETQSLYLLRRLSESWLDSLVTSARAGAFSVRRG